MLSGQDYPLVHHTELEAFLAREERMRTCPTCGRSGRCELTGEPRDEFVLRYGYRHFEVPWVPPRLPRRLAYGRPAADREASCWASATPARPELPLHVSGDWPTLNRRALRSVLGFPGRHPRLMRRYRHSFAASESFFATALMNDPELTVGGRPPPVHRLPAPARPTRGR